MMKAEDRILIKNLAYTAEIINTINGGMAEPAIKIRKEETEWLVRVKVPGVSVDNMKIEVKDHQMFLFHLIAEGNASDVEIPYLMAALTLSRKVDFDGIVAEYHHGELFIHLPLDEEANGYEREIDILKK